MKREKLPCFFSPFCFVLIFSVCQLSLSQVPGPPNLPTALTDHRVFISNDYLWVLGGYGDNDTAAEAKAFGNFTIYTTYGDPESPNDDYKAILSWDTSSNKITSFASMRIYPVPGLMPGWWDPNDEYLEGKFSEQNATGDLTGGNLTLIRRPIVLGNSIYSRARIKLGTETVAGVSQDVNIELEQRATLMRDALKLEYKITNTTRSSLNIGFRLLLDTTVDLLDINSVIPFRLPNFQTIYNEEEITEGLPSYWWQYLPPYGSSPLTQGTIVGYEATPPDRMAFAGYPFISPTVWDYTVDPTLSLIDGAVAIWWDPRIMAPGESRTLVCYYGLGNASSDYNPPFVFAVGSRPSLEYMPGDDPSTPAVVETSYISPKPFIVTAYIYNTSSAPITEANVYISLPKGLSLDSGESARKPIICPIESNAEGKASWRVIASGDPAGKLQFSVSATVIPLAFKSVNRTVDVPSVHIRSFESGIHMISVPFKFDNPDAHSALPGLISAGNFARWSPIDGTYYYYPHSYVFAISPGKAYWLRLFEPKVANASTGTPIDPTKEYLLGLDPGWNQIGSPFNFSIYWWTAKVSYGYEVKDLLEAVTAGWLRGTLYRYTGDPLNPYEVLNELDAQLVPWQGYWLKALVPCTLMLQPAYLPSRATKSLLKEPRSLPASSPSVNNWKVQIVASAGNLRDAQNFLGVSPGASDGYDLQDIDEPPPPLSPYLSLRFVHPDWGRDSGDYMQDIRAPITNKKIWQLEVETDLKNAEVVLSWPNLTEVPRKYRLTLEDLETGRKLYMRTSSAYVYNSGPSGGRRRFQVVVELASALSSKPLISILSCRASRAEGVSISFSLSEPAKVEAKIISLSGRLIRKLAVDSLYKAGVNMLYWDGKDAQGTPIPPGPYLCQMTARTEELRQAKANKMFVIK